MRDISRKEKETRGKDREDEKKTSKFEEKVVQRLGNIGAKVAMVSSSTSDMKRPGRPAGSVNKTKTQKIPNGGKNEEEKVQLRQQSTPVI